MDLNQLLAGLLCLITLRLKEPKDVPWSFLDRVSFVVHMDSRIVLTLMRKCL